MQKMNFTFDDQTADTKGKWSQEIQATDVWLSVQFGPADSLGWITSLAVFYPQY